MNVKELITWLQAFPDQEAVVQVMKHDNNSGSYYCQGGTMEIIDFNPEGAYTSYNEGYEYTDFRENPFVKENCPHYNLRTLLLGERN